LSERLPVKFGISIFILVSGCREFFSSVASRCFAHAPLLLRSLGFSKSKAVCFLKIPFNSQLVGLLGIEPSLHAPHACVLPVYYSPRYLYFSRFGGGLPVGRHGSGSCVKLFQALRANQSPLAGWQFGSLKIGVFSAPISRVVVASQELSCANHYGTLFANRALSHKFRIF